MNIAEIRFKAVEVDSWNECSGCMFYKESFSTCEAACEKAVQDGLPDCEDLAPSGNSYVYVLDESDPRQMNLLDKEH
jgi:hypothetical protein